MESVYGIQWLVRPLFLRKLIAEEELTEDCHT